MLQEKKEHDSMKCQIYKIVNVVCLLIISMASFSSEIPETEFKKIEFLKSELVNSHCQFERNGNLYTVEEAISHINKKHEYYMKKIDSASDFIELAATKSMMSGKPYYMICKNESKVETSIWLINRLKSFY